MKNMFIRVYLTVILLTGSFAMADDKEKNDKSSGDKIYALIDISYADFPDTNDEIGFAEVKYFHDVHYDDINGFTRAGNYIDMSMLETRESCATGNEIVNDNISVNTEAFRKAERRFLDYSVGIAGFQEPDGYAFFTRIICLPYHIVEDIDFNKWREIDVTPRPYRTDKPLEKDVLEKHTAKLAYGLEELFKRLEQYDDISKLKVPPDLKPEPDFGWIYDSDSDWNKTMFIFPLNQANGNN